jgi:hypothetical protein
LAMRLAERTMGFGAKGCGMVVQDGDIYRLQRNCIGVDWKIYNTNIK